MESESHFNNVFSLGQVEPVQDGRQPGVEICRLATPGRCIKLRRFETGTRLLNEGGGGSAMVVEWELMMSFAVCSQASRSERSYMKNSRLASTW